jgi:hypothetical protein
MAFLMRTGRMLLQLVTFLVLLAVLSKAITFVTAERYTGVGEPSRLFPIVAVQQPPAVAGQYELLRWGGLRNLVPADVPRFKLPEAQGAFALPMVGGFEPSVQFRSAPEADGRARVSVTVTDDDYVVYSTYITDGTNITPVNFRIWGPSSMLLALIPAVVLTWALSRLVAWWRRRRAEAAPQA